MKKQLFSLSKSNFTFPSDIDEFGRLESTAAGSIPLVLWPDGSWCFFANSFLYKEFARGLAKNIDGGTLATYAYELSHFIRFCFENGIQFQEFSDSDFVRFARGLTAERDIRDPTRFCRDANTVIEICRLALKFLSYVGQIFHIQNFVAPHGQIRVNVEVVKIPHMRGERSESKGEITVWTHAAMPKRVPEKKRSPISSKAIHALNAAVKQVSNSTFVRIRRYVLILLLEATGARRSEIAMLTVQDVENAYLMDEPMLSLRTIKRKGDRVAHRMLPITKADVKQLRDYVRLYRGPLIKATCGEENDCGSLLVSETTGKSLAYKTISSEIFLLRKAAGLEEKACAHMFRHRFVTKTLIAMIEHCDAADKDSFRAALRTRYDLLQRLLQYTGHTSLHSLERYIDLAFVEISKFPALDDQVRMARTVDSALRRLEKILEICESDVSTATSEFRSLAEELRDDLRPRSKGAALD